MFQSSLLSLRVLSVLMASGNLTLSEIAYMTGRARDGHLARILTRLCAEQVLIRWLDDSVYPAVYRYEVKRKVVL